MDSKVFFIVLRIISWGTMRPHGNTVPWPSLMSVLSEDWDAGLWETAFTG